MEQKSSRQRSRTQRSPAPDWGAVREKYEKHLPIYQKRSEIVETIRKHQVTIIAGETGSGKTTQLPLFCIEAGRGRRGSIGCTQPRRIAAMSIAQRVSKLLGQETGGIVGYKIRFTQKESSQTRVKFMTDGILLSEIHSDRMLKQYDTIIVDEAHERSLNIDFLIGVLRELITRRKDLKIIISSATIDTELFSRAFNNAPVIEVTGRMYPVDIMYVPPDMEGGDMPNYVDQAIRTVRTIVDMGEEGDILVFMPTAADIRETVERLSGTDWPHKTIVLPLYGRLSIGEQNKIFSPAHGQKVVVATNIAETSITVPNIRFVVDTGFARTIRYVPHQRTTRMPIESISQASANQRSGRCGRVRDGVCFRLYSEQDFASRESFTMPEIRRTNLAGVILQMAFIGLGEIELFPFLEPPTNRAISDGYTVLTELGALDRERQLTPLGRKMARLPLDPHIARMILQAADESALREIKIIAAGLSIIDPRFRPPEKEAQADAAHKRFRDPKSDFLTYLKLWDTYQSELTKLKTQRKMRAFCNEHFLSFIRMREWFDVHHQIAKICARIKGLRDNEKPATYDAIHKSLLSGLLLNVAVKIEDSVAYRGTKGRELYVFPGSSLFKKDTVWIMCHEIVETTRVYARTVAQIKSQWVEPLAKDMCRYSYTDPHFHQKSGTVMAREQVLFFGLPIIRRRRVPYGRINQSEAKEIFIRQGLVEEQLRTHYRFYKHNKRLRQKIENLEAKLRTRRLFAGDEAIVSFYASRLPGVTSIHDLHKIIKKHKGDQFLFMNEEDLMTGTVPAWVHGYPDTVQIGPEKIKLVYRFEPGEERDGISVTVTRAQYANIHSTAFEWALPALWQEKVKSLMEHLPKRQREKLQPLEENAKKIIQNFTYTGQPFIDEFCTKVQNLFRINLTESDFRDYEPPPALWIRVVIVGDNDEVVDVFRTPGKPAVLVARDERKRLPLFASFERRGLKRWNFGDIPEVITIDDTRGMPLFGYPALQPADASVNVVVCNNEKEAKQIHAKGLAFLFELTLASDLGWAQKELKLTKPALLRSAAWCTKGAVLKALFTLIHNETVKPVWPLIYNEDDFLNLCEERRQMLSGVGFEISGLFEEITQKVHDCIKFIDKKAQKYNSKVYNRVKKELAEETGWFIRKIFDPWFTLTQLRQYPRYLSAFRERINCGFEEPNRYDQRMDLLHHFYSYIDAAPEFDLFDARTIELQELELMIDEFALSLFGPQSLKPLFPVSEKRLHKRIEELKRRGVL